MNKTVVELLKINIAGAIAKSKAISDISHPLLKGKFREIFASEILLPFLPPFCGMGTGSIIDSVNSKRKINYTTKEGESKVREKSEDDIVIYDKEITPQIMFSAREGLFPFESTLITIEVKSKLEKEDLVATIEDAIALDTQLKRIPPDPAKLESPGIVVMLFAFDSTTNKEDIKDLIKKTLQQKNGYDKNGTPRFFGLCIVGKGTWLYAKTPSDENSEWKLIDADEQYSEVISFVSCILDSINILKKQKGHPTFGNYLLSKSP